LSSKVIKTAFAPDLNISGNTANHSQAFLIILEGLFNINHFYQMRNVMKRLCCQSPITYFLLGFSNFLHFFHLFGKLCAGRNGKASVFVQEVFGLNDQLCLKVIDSSALPVALRAIFFDLFIELFLVVHEAFPYCVDLNYPESGRKDQKSITTDERELELIVIGHNRHFDFKDLQFLFNGIFEVGICSHNMLLVIIKLLRKCIRLRLYTRWDEINDYLKQLYLLSNQSPKAVAALCDVLNLAYEIEIQVWIKKIKKAFGNTMHNGAEIRIRNEIRDMCSLFDKIPIIQLEPETGNTNNASETDRFFSEDAWCCILKTVSSCEMLSSTLLSRLENINFLELRMLEMHKRASHYLNIIWGFHWDIQNTEAQKFIGTALETFTEQCKDPTSRKNSQIFPNHSSQRMFQKLGAHICVLQLLENWVSFPYVESSSVIHGNIRKCFIFLASFCFDFTENQNVLYNFLPRLLRISEIHLHPQAFFAISAIFEGNETLVPKMSEHDLMEMLNVIIRPMLKSRHKHILLFLSRFINSRTKTIILNFVTSQKEAFQPLSFDELKALSQSVSQNYENEEIRQLEYHRAFVNLIESCSEGNIGFIEHHFPGLFLLQQILCVLESSDIIFEMKLSYFNLLRKTYLCYHIYVQNILNEESFWKFIFLSFVLVQRNLKILLLERVPVLNLVSKHLTPFIRNFFSKWINLISIPDDRIFYLEMLKNDIELFNLSESQMGISRNVHIPDDEIINLEMLKNDIDLFNRSESQMGISRNEEKSKDKPKRTIGKELDQDNRTGLRWSNRKRSMLHIRALYQRIQEHSDVKSNTPEHFQAFVSNFFKQEKLLSDQRVKLLSDQQVFLNLWAQTGELQGSNILKVTNIISKRLKQLSRVRQTEDIDKICLLLKSLTKAAECMYRKPTESFLAHLRKKKYSKYKKIVSKRKDVQDHFVRIGTVEIALSLFLLREPTISKCSLNLLCCLLEAGNLYTQSQFLKLLRDNPLPHFCSHISHWIQESTQLLRICSDSEQSRPGAPSSMINEFLFNEVVDVQALELVFRVLQLLCEGHNKDAQRYLVQQAEKLENYDLVEATLIFWRELENANNQALYSLEIQVLNTLIEYCQGCIDNQYKLFKCNVIESLVDILQDQKAQCETEQKCEEHTLKKKILAGNLLLSLLEGSSRGRGVEIANEISNDFVSIFLAQMKVPDSYPKEYYLLARELGYTMYTILSTLKPHIPTSFLVSHWKGESVDYFSKEVRSIEIVRPIRGEKVFEKVFFLLPCSKSYLTRKVKASVRSGIDQASMKLKLEEFLSKADNLVIHIKNQELLDKHVPFIHFLNEDKCSAAAYVVILAINFVFLYTYSQDNKSTPPHQDIIQVLSSVYLALWVIVTFNYFMCHLMVKFKIKIESKRRLSQCKTKETHNSQQGNVTHVTQSEGKVRELSVSDPVNQKSQTPELHPQQKPVHINAQRKQHQTFFKGTVEFLHNPCTWCVEYVDTFSKRWKSNKKNVITISKKLLKIDPSAPSALRFYLSVLSIPLTDLALIYHLLILVLTTFAHHSKVYVLYGFPLLDIIYRIDTLRDILKAVAYFGK
jgi:hypothetical protein